LADLKIKYGLPLRPGLHMPPEIRTAMKDRVEQPDQEIAEAQDELKRETL